MDTCLMLIFETIQYQNHASRRFTACIRPDARLIASVPLLDLSLSTLDTPVDRCLSLITDF